MISITCSDCVFVALVIQHAVSMHHAVLSSVASPAVSYFFTFLEKKLLNIPSVHSDFFYSFGLKKCILRRIKQDINIHTSLYNVPVNLVEF